MRRLAVMAALGSVAAGWIATAARVPLKQGSPAPSMIVRAEPGKVDRPRRREPPRRVRRTVMRFVAAFARYEVGRGGSRSRTVLRRRATPGFARRLLRRPPRVSRDLARARLHRVVVGRVDRRRATAVATLARDGRAFALVVVAQRGTRGWRVAEVRR